MFLILRPLTDFCPQKQVRKGKEFFGKNKFFWKKFEKCFFLNYATSSFPFSLHFPHGVCVETCRLAVHP